MQTEKTQYVVDQDGCSSCIIEAVSHEDACRINAEEYSAEGTMEVRERGSNETLVFDVILYRNGTCDVRNSNAGEW